VASHFAKRRRAAKPRGRTSSEGDDTHVWLTTTCSRRQVTFWSRRKSG
jgi:hypothetical protein